MSRRPTSHRPQGRSRRVTHGNQRTKNKSKRAHLPQTAEQYFGSGERFQNTLSRVTHAITKMRSDGISLTKAAREIGISPSTVLRWGKSALRKNASGRYVARKTDRLLRVLLIPTAQGPSEVAVANSRDASLLAQYWDALQKYLETGDSSALEKFRDVQITDATGAKQTLLTDLNELNRLGSAGVLGFESLYAKSA